MLLAGHVFEPLCGIIRATTIARHREERAMIATVLTALVALLHLYFLVLEMFLWDKPAGLKAFGNTPQRAADTKVLAANQGLYNGFLAAGLLWGLVQGAAGGSFKVFFLLCVIVAGVYGAATASRKILFVQALPGALALAALYLGL
jgi:putative membrane protein